MRAVRERERERKRAIATMRERERVIATTREEEREHGYDIHILYYIL